MNRMFLTRALIRLNDTSLEGDATATYSIDKNNLYCSLAIRKGAVKYIARRLVCGLNVPWNMGIYNGGIALALADRTVRLTVEGVR